MRGLEGKAAIVTGGSTIIGQAVVRELIALHGGRAWVEAPADGGAGARFIVEWPLAPPPPREAPTA